MLKLIFLIFLCLLLIIHSTNGASFRLCSSEQLTQFVGRCGPIERELVDLRNSTEDYYPKPEIVNNMTDLCQKVANCYGSIKCAESIDKMNQNKFQCDEDRLMFGEVPECIKWLFKEIYMVDYYDCLKDYDFLSYNMETKRKAFTSGKSCVFQVFNESQLFECDRDAVELIHKNYDLIVDYLTTDSSKKLCRGVNPLYQKLQCEVIKDKWLSMDSELINSGNNTQEEIAGFLELGNVLKECMSHSCLYTKKEKSYVDYRQKETKFRNSPFVKCATKIYEKKINTYEKYPCLKNQEPKEKTECKKLMLEELCGKEAADNLEETQEFFEFALGNNTEIIQ
ncbi:hypothetical protein CRE_09317 [Caenorhabditis remanei]|uniref:T20D4.11-like domain-containing protein n=1 Tax=Caenorhabditis remanei TaxID=31234 RepID=E3LI43_CAERE|nr:hypothetical protein CRE_09317 [Caenorhabditis remanei]